MFTKAVKRQLKLKMVLEGASGSGKTYTALHFAQKLGSRIAVVDTEGQSAAFYADLVPFDVVELEPPFHPRKFIKAIKCADEAGYDVLILDSLSHAWMGAGGLLEVVDEIAERKARERRGRPDSYSAWNEGSRIQRQMVEAMLRSDLHLIATLRMKQAYARTTDDRGRTKIEKLGMEPQQREGLDYEFGVVATLDQAHQLVVTKSRCPAISGAVVSKPTGDFLDPVIAWLNSGEAPARPPVPAPQANPEPTRPQAVAQNGAVPEEIRAAFAQRFDPIIQQFGIDKKRLTPFVEIAFRKQRLYDCDDKELEMFEEWLKDGAPEDTAAWIEEAWPQFFPGTWQGARAA